jgi:purine-binding chemotaxis protein CheW
MSNLIEKNLEENQEFVTFSAGDQIFCVPITYIREIRRWTSVTVLPHTPMDVLGVMNLRGSVIPIIDLSQRFGLGPTETGERNVVIIAIHGKNSIGMLVQSVSEILSLHKSEIQDTVDVPTSSHPTFVTVIISKNDHMIRVIDLVSVLDG